MFELILFAGLVVLVESQLVILALTCTDLVLLRLWCCWVTVVAQYS